MNDNVKLKADRNPQLGIINWELEQRDTANVRSLAMTHSWRLVLYVEWIDVMQRCVADKKTKTDMSSRGHMMVATAHTTVPSKRASSSVITRVLPERQGLAMVLEPALRHRQIYCAGSQRCWLPTVKSTPPSHPRKALLYGGTDFWKCRPANLTAHYEKQAHEAFIRCSNVTATEKPSVPVSTQCPPTLRHRHTLEEMYSSVLGHHPQKSRAERSRLCGGTLFSPVCHQRPCCKAAYHHKWWRWPIFWNHWQCGWRWDMFIFISHLHIWNYHVTFPIHTVFISIVILHHTWNDLLWDCLPCPSPIIYLIFRCCGSEGNILTTNGGHDVVHSRQGYHLNLSIWKSHK